jgi:zinc/manganese transport system ATP-binding protein
MKHSDTQVPEGLVLHNLTVGYDRHPALHHLNLCIPKGALVAVVGPNGAGKTTLLRTLAGELSPMSGHVQGLPASVAYLPQRCSLDVSFPVSVWEMVAMGLWHRMGAMGGMTAAMRRECAAALEQVGLTGFENRHVDALSGGQLQRALFARLALQDATLVLLDEPFAAVDAPTKNQLLGVLKHWQTQGKTVLTVTHDLAQAAEHFPSTLLLARQWAEFGHSREVISTFWHQAMQMPGPFDQDALVCVRPETSLSHMAGTERLNA